MTRDRLLQLMLSSVFMICTALPASMADSIQDDRVLLAKCVLSYEYQSGPRAPRYRENYSVTISPSRSVKFWYQFGSGPLSSETETHDFRISLQQQQRVISTLASAGVLRDRWQRKARANRGGGQETFTIEEPSGKIITITSLLEGESLERFRDIVDAIQSTVPKSAWTDKDDARRDYQQDTEK